VPIQAHDAWTPSIDYQCRRRHEPCDRRLCDRLFDERRDDLSDERRDDRFEEFEERLDELLDALYDRLYDRDGPCPPAAISNSSSLNSIAPAGFSGRSA
jgi:hypothetical protein